MFLNRALNSAVLTDGMARYISSTIAPNSYAAIGIRTRVSQNCRVAPDWDLSEALPTEVHGRGKQKMNVHRAFLQQRKNIFVRNSLKYFLDGPMRPRFLIFGLFLTLIGRNVFIMAVGI